MLSVPNKSVAASGGGMPPVSLASQPRRVSCQATGGGAQGASGRRSSWRALVERGVKDPQCAGREPVAGQGPGQAASRRGQQARAACPSRRRAELADSPVPSHVEGPQLLHGPHGRQGAAQVAGALRAPQRSARRAAAASSRWDGRHHANDGQARQGEQRGRDGPRQVVGVQAEQRQLPKGGQAGGYRAAHLRAHPQPGWVHLAVLEQPLCQHAGGRGTHSVALQLQAHEGGGQRRPHRIRDGAHEAAARPRSAASGHGLRAHDARGGAHLYSRKRPATPPATSHGTSWPLVKKPKKRLLRATASVREAAGQRLAPTRCRGRRRAVRAHISK